MLRNPNRVNQTPEMIAMENELKMLISPFKVSLGVKVTLEQMQDFNKLAEKYNALSPKSNEKVLFKL